MYRLVVVFAAGCEVVFPLPTSGLPADGSTGDGASVLLDSDVSDGTALTCPASYTIAFGTTSRYRMTSEQKTFDLSQLDCRNDGSSANSTGFTHLVVLDNQEELDELTNINTDVRWIGLRRVIAGQNFSPVTTQSTMFPPQSGEPWAKDEPATVDKCAALDALEPEHLIGEDCMTAFVAVCECDAFQP